MRDEPECVASGYAIYADGKLVKFASVSNGEVQNFLSIPESTLMVDVEAKKTGEELEVVTITNQQ